MILLKKILFLTITSTKHTQSSTWKMPLLQTGQSAFSLISQGSMQSLWKECPHRSTFTESPSLNSQRHTAHVGRSSTFVDFLFLSESRRAHFS